jgi:hypothetical protein
MGFVSKIMNHGEQITQNLVRGEGQKPIGLVVVKTWTQILDSGRWTQDFAFIGLHRLDSTSARLCCGGH